ncbi:MAG: FtsX-like permease family protein [Lentisphaerae bacterium]|nr:FtsX-like permease family protein [Lentisphaerota bacterium]
MNIVWIYELAVEGAKNLYRHKLRSTLTILGIVFGVGAVITMMGIGEGAQRTVLKEIGGLGLRNIIIDSVQPTISLKSDNSQNSRRGSVLNFGLTKRDVLRIQSALPDSNYAICHMVKGKIFFGAKRINAKALGVPSVYFKFFRTTIIDGTLFHELNDANMHRVAVITEEVAKAMNIPGGPINEKIRIGKNLFTVIGIVDMPVKKAEGAIFIPYSTADGLYGKLSVQYEAGSSDMTRNEVGQLVIQLQDENMISAAAPIVDRIIRDQHPADDFSITVPMDLLKARQRTQRILNLVLLLIAAISLVVGGIGIMNIMLAIVTERIPEIGIRRALGATGQDILFQFLAEAIVLSSAGGLMGCLMGFILVPIASLWTGWEGVITPGAAIVSIAVAWLVGVTFGITPALRASKLEHVSCLRNE